MKLEARIEEHKGRIFHRKVLVIEIPEELKDFHLVPAFGSDGSKVYENIDDNTFRVHMRKVKTWKEIDNKSTTE